MRKLTLEALDIVDAIDRRGSFSAAAEVLHKVPSTISYTVAKMEEDLGVALFRRNGPRIEMTKAGRELLREGRLLLQAAGDLECRVKRVASGWEGELRIALDSILRAEVLSPLIADFHREAGDTLLAFKEEALTGTWEALLDARADIVVAVGPGPSGGGYRSVEVARLDFVFCVAPFHPLARFEGPLDEAQLRTHKAIVVADSARRLPSRSTGLLDGQSKIVVPDMCTKFRLQAEGLGAGYLPTLCAQQALDSGALVTKEVQHPKPPEQVSVAWRPGDEGKALAWWRDRLADPGAMASLIASAARAYNCRTPPQRQIGDRHSAPAASAA